MRSYFFYKRVNHFNEILNLLEAQSEIEIPDEVIDRIRAKLLRDNFEINDLDHRLTKRYLKENSHLYWNMYYEVIPKICQLVKGNEYVGLNLTQNEREKLTLLFEDASIVYNEIRPPTRCSFLSYPFVIYKLANLAGIKRIHNYIERPYLLSQLKNQEMEQIWKKLCQRLRWPTNEATIEEYRAVSTIQHHWRKILIERQRQRNLIGEQIMYYPGTGIKYFEVLNTIKQRVSDTYPEIADW